MLLEEWWRWWLVGIGNLASRIDCYLGCHFGDDLDDRCDLWGM